MVMETIAAALSLSAAVNAASASRRARRATEQLDELERHDDNAPEQEGAPASQGLPPVVAYPEVVNLLPLALYFDTEDANYGRSIRLRKLAGVNRPGSMTFFSTESPMEFLPTGEDDLFESESHAVISWSRMVAAFPNAVVMCFYIAK